MRAVYATQFRMPNANFEDISQHVENWVVNRYKARWDHQIDLQYDGEIQRPLEGHRVKMPHEEVDGGQFLELEWIHPDSNSTEEREWKTEITLAERDDTLEVSVILRVGSTSFAVQPIGKISLGTPRVIRVLMRRYECQSAHIEITDDHTRVTASEVGMLVRHIQYPNRALPIVLISQDERGKTARPVSDIQDKLLGLAHVYEIERSAAFELTRQIGKSSSCFGGAIRVYWPGFKPSSYVRHPLYFPKSISEFEKEGKLLEDYLFRKFANIAASRFSEGKIWKQLKKKVSRRRLNELSHLRDRVSEQRSHATEEEEFLEEMELLLDQNEELLEENEALREKVDHLEDDLATAQENLMSAYYHTDETSVSDDLDKENEITDRSLNTVASALKQASIDFEDRISVWGSAKSSAEESAFGRPKEVYDAIQAIAELCGRYFKGESHSTGGPWKGFFKKRNLDYSQESDMTMNMHGEEREFMYDGEQHRTEHHLTLGGGSRKHCVQIYFIPHDGSKTFAIPYCGPHLPYYRQNT